MCVHDPSRGEAMHARGLPVRVGTGDHRRILGKALQPPRTTGAGRGTISRNKTLRGVSPRSSRPRAIARHPFRRRALRLTHGCYDERPSARCDQILKSWTPLDATAREMPAIRLIRVSGLSVKRQLGPISFPHVRRIVIHNARPNRGEAVRNERAPLERAGWSLTVRVR